MKEELLKLIEEMTAEELLQAIAAIDAKIAEKHCGAGDDDV